MSSRLKDRQLLGVAQTATKKEIRRRYIELAKKYHPDVAKASGITEGPDIRDITAAYQRLIGKESYVASNTAARRYDERPPEARHGATHQEQQQYTKWSLLAGLSLVSSVVAYALYEPPKDDIHLPGNRTKPGMDQVTGNGARAERMRGMDGM
ncbi:hypothetical protein BJV82DRAFT_576397 [Fennellomyces sp. T-0311]|nr:hypothetical protein BJV82DRAFT_576397 [Fennellomyces sp. T-0311]